MRNGTRFTMAMPGTDNANREPFGRLQWRGSRMWLAVIVALAAVLALLVFWIPGSDVPRVALGPARVKPQIAVGSTRIVLLAWDGSLWTWAGGTKPHRLGLETDWKAVALGRLDLALLKTDGTLWRWPGSGGFDKAAPSRLSPATNWRAVAANDFDFSALRDDGTLWIWSGQEEPSRLDNEWLPRGRATTPQGKLVPLVSASNWVSIAGGLLTMSTVRDDGTLWGWARTLPPIMLMQPVQCGDETNWAAVHDSGSETMLARKRDGSCWTGGPWIHGLGGPFTGLLERYPPKGMAQVEEMQDWGPVAVGTCYVLGLRSDGTLHGFGVNETGVLGSPRGLVRKGPLQIGGRHDWVAIGAGKGAAVGLTADGTVWAWGERVDDVPATTQLRQLAASWFGLGGIEVERRITIDPRDGRRGPGREVQNSNEETHIFSLSPTPILRFGAPRQSPLSLLKRNGCKTNGQELMQFGLAFFDGFTESPYSFFQKTGGVPGSRSPAQPLVLTPVRADGHTP